MNKKTLIALASALVLGACGGGGGGPVTAASDAVPDSASASPEGLVAWVTALSAEDTEAKEPLDLSGYTAPTSETAEPVALR